MQKQFLEKIPSFLVVATLSFIFLLFTAETIDLSTADLGRHLKNGELFFTQILIPQTNLYSYTNPDFPFFNHHWGSGVVFYLLEKIGGFPLLSLFFLALYLGAFILFFRIAWQSSTLRIASLVSLLFLPLIGTRAEVRPEVFSYLFCAVFLFLILKYKEGKITKTPILIALPIIELIWVNTHIYFLFGIAIIGVFLFETAMQFFISKKIESRTRLQTLIWTFILSCLTACVNPAGIKGVLYPFTIFKNYGYNLLENQSISAIDRLVIYPPTLYFKIAIILLGLSIIAGFIQITRKRLPFPTAMYTLALIFSVLGFMQIRNFGLFSFFALPVLSTNIALLRPNTAKKESALVTFILIVLVLLALILINPAYYDSKGQKFGIGLSAGVNNAVDFYKAHNLKGPIFNDYDIGGYLIYHLYPETKVFVDNRPEAYPVSFFTQEYIPMQQNDKIWREELARYNFNTIFFSRNDITPWGQQFLVSRISDSDWAPVFFDNYHIIFLRRNGPNQDVIQTYELPKSMFSVKKQ